MTAKMTPAGQMAGAETRQENRLKQKTPGLSGAFCYRRAKLLYTGYETKTEIVTEKKGEIYVAQKKT